MWESDTGYLETGGQERNIKFHIFDKLGHMACLHCQGSLAILSIYDDHHNVSYSSKQPSNYPKDSN